MTSAENGSFGIIVTRLAELQLASLAPRATEPIHRAMAELASSAKACDLSTAATPRPQLQLDAEGYRLRCELDLEAQTVTALSVTPIAATREERPLRILLVDDDRLLLTLLGDQIRHAGHEVVSVESAEDALRHPLEGFDAIVCDFVMPGLSGCELLRRVREEHRASTPFVFITSSRQTELLAHQAVRYDADLLVKPVDCDRLLGRIAARRAERRWQAESALAG
jgi:CheY-like chemotaxis protein